MEYPAGRCGVFEPVHDFSSETHDVLTSSRNLLGLLGRICTDPFRRPFLYRLSRFQATGQGQRWLGCKHAAAYGIFRGLTVAPNLSSPAWTLRKALIRVVFMRDLQPYWSTYMKLHQLQLERKGMGKKSTW